MNHYLHNIAAKSLDVAPTVKPRLPGRFEPASNLAGATHLAKNPEGERIEGENATDEVLPQVARRPDRWQQVSHESERLSAPAQSPQSNHSREAESRVPPTETVRVVQPEILAAPMSFPYPPIKDRLPVMGSSSTTNSPDDLSPGSTVAVTQNESSVKTLSDSASALPKQILRSASLVNQRHLQSSQPIPVKTTLSDKGSTMITSPQTQPSRVVLPQAQADAGHSKPTPPPIQVTIGRIDVRAITPMPAARRPAAKPLTPKPSLNDYLKTRQKSLHGGGR